METFKTLEVIFTYNGITYNHVVSESNVCMETDTWWESWAYKGGNHSFQVCGGMNGDTPIYIDIQVIVYPPAWHNEFDGDEKIDVINECCVVFLDK